VRWGEIEVDLESGSKPGVEQREPVGLHGTRLITGFVVSILNDDTIEVMRNQQTLGASASAESIAQRKTKRLASERSEPPLNSPSGRITLQTHGYDKYTCTVG
jgi:hypothetical protein